MKRTFLGALLIAISSLVLAQSGSMKGMDMKEMPTKNGEVKGTVHKATGVVTAVDESKVTIKHEPVQSMNWPPMTMAFTVRDKALMDKLGKGKKVDFEFVQEGKNYVVTSVK